MSIIARLLDFISPRQCQVCGERLALSEQDICAACNWLLPRTLFSRNAYENEMAKCFWGRIPIERSAALVYYRPKGKMSNLVCNIKYHNDPGLGYRIGMLLARDFLDDGFFEGIDAIVPIPITKMRRWHRGYNQSLLIAKGISEVTGLPVYTDVVKRISFSGSQTRRSRSERATNVQGVFKANNPEKVASKHILLVDDIVTTGATIVSCASEISKVVDVKFSVASLGFTKA